MTGFIGEYHCKLDAKGRLSLPADMRKQLSPDDADSFVISRGVDDCLSLYTMSEWDRVMEKLRSLNRFKAKDRKFARMFQKGATKLSLDSSGRLLFPKALMGWAGIQKDIVLVANVDLWEVWDKKRYEELLDSDWEEFEGLAAEVMGDGDDE
ncbi:division/cell wall cluster transcriptional repressor MraZ [Parvicella tangerina]|uniref:Transcriptional regulator MraZ n=1 Tax=Parvicella tangerina TaxID=2829795 RepID=A0A916JQ40_9FLAO|nr:division/cell wall cluster transcriptional repressor MraZ [Parvicella tangerina]CAG5085712.1 Transcriptional regulator MraZ [Parvicella tangerina]